MDAKRIDNDVSSASSSSGEDKMPLLVNRALKSVYDLHSLPPFCLLNGILTCRVIGVDGRCQSCIMLSALEDAQAAFNQCFALVMDLITEMGVAEQREVTMPHDRALFIVFLAVLYAVASATSPSIVRQVCLALTIGSSCPEEAKKRAIERMKDSNPDRSKSADSGLSDDDIILRGLNGIDDLKGHLKGICTCKGTKDDEWVELSDEHLERCHGDNDQPGVSYNPPLNEHSRVPRSDEQKHQLDEFVGLLRQG